MDIKEIKKKINNEEYEISFHAEKERYAEEITISDLENAVCSGEILEDYPDSPRGPSCLILGYSGNRPMWLYTNRMDQNNNCIYTKATKMVG